MARILKISAKTQARINAALDKHLGARMLTVEELKARANWPLVSVRFNHSPAPLLATQIGELADRAFSAPGPFLVASPTCTHHSTAAPQRRHKTLLDLVLDDIKAKGLSRG